MKPLNRLLLTFALVLGGYFAFVFYLVRWDLHHEGPLPAWARWGLALLFVLSFTVLAVAVRAFAKKKSVDVAASPTMITDEPPAKKPIKKLLVTYLILLPITLVSVFFQKVVPVKLALLALIVPILVAIWLWRLSLSSGGKGQTGDRNL